MKPDTDEVIRAWTNLRRKLMEKSGEPVETIHERLFQVCTKLLKFDAITQERRSTSMS